MLCFSRDGNCLRMCHNITYSQNSPSALVTSGAGVGFTNGACPSPNPDGIPSQSPGLQGPGLPRVSIHEFSSTATRLWPIRSVRCHANLPISAISPLPGLVRLEIPLNQTKSSYFRLTIPKKLVRAFLIANTIQFLPCETNYYVKVNNYTHNLSNHGPLQPAQL